MTEVNELKTDESGYEVTYFLTTESIQSVTTALQAANAVVSSERSLERVSLAYPIKKQRQAFMGVMRFSADSEEIPKILRALNLQADILRSIVVNLSFGDTRGSPRGMSQQMTFRKRERSAVPETRMGADGGALTNEALEKKIEEISK